MSADEITTNAQTIVTITDSETGEERVITDKDITDILSGETDNGRLNEYVESCYEVVDSYGGGLCSISLNPPRSEIANSDTVPIFASEDGALRPGIYYALYDHQNGRDFDDEELFNINTASDNGLLLASDVDLVSGGGIGFTPVTISPVDESGEMVENPPYEPLHVYMMRSVETGNYVTVHDLLRGLYASAAVSIALERMQKDGSLTVARESAAGGALFSINSTNIDEIDFTTDKVNRKTWNQWATLKPGQIAAGFKEDGSADLLINLANAADRQKGIDRPMSYIIDFDMLENEGIAPKLEPYDKRVYEACSSLWNHITTSTGQDVFSIKDIYFAMGYTSNPGQNDKKKINDSLTKMSKAHISVDNLEESNVYHYPHFSWDSSLLPMERITGYVDGQITDGLIHLFREPPLFTFARQRGQFTTYSVKLLQSPLSKTNKNLLIEDYIREEVAWMKNRKSTRSNKITLYKIYEAANITRRDDKLRKRKDIVKLLKHYVECEFIEGFKDEPDGFTIFF